MNRQIVNRRYRIERKIGEGGTGEVYLAFDIVLNRRVAIKMLEPRLAANRAFRLRFEREAQATANLSHPNIIAIFDVGEQENEPYIVMEYIEGQTLKEIIEDEGPFHPDDVAVLVEQVASALDYAHGRGVIHRDIKPQNILVDRQGLAKVVDFGIAKALNDSTLTQTGTGLGTVHYISPEQASGLMATPESDIYSLGVIAFEMLTGLHPFDADNAIGIAMRHVNDPPPDPAELNPDVPPEAADVVLRALEKNPARRFPSAGAFAGALTSWRDYRAAPRPPVRFPTPAMADPQALTTRISSPPRRQTASVDGNTGVSVSASANRDADPAPQTRGSRSWIGGLAAVAAIAALIAYGLGAFDRDANGNQPEPTATSRAVASAPTATATRPALIFQTPAPESEFVVVPALLGQAEGEALASVEALDLRMVVSAREPSESIDAGRVMAQEPPADAEVEAGTEIEVVVSTGTGAIDLASIVTTNRTWQDVAAELQSVGLDVSSIEQGSESVPEGEVIRIDPSEPVFPGDAVTLIVSIGDQVRIPVSLQGAPVEEAESELAGLGLTVSGLVPVSAEVLAANGVDVEQFGIADGDVVGIQDNGAQFGEWIARGTSVTLVYFEADPAPTIAPSS